MRLTFLVNSIILHCASACNNPILFVYLLVYSLGMHVSFSQEANIILIINQRRQCSRKRSRSGPGKVINILFNIHLLECLTFYLRYPFLLNVNKYLFRYMACQDFPMRQYSTPNLFARLNIKINLIINLSQIFLY